MINEEVDRTDVTREEDAPTSGKTGNGCWIELEVHLALILS